jgi:class 3 adenylate cyclase
MALFGAKKKVNRSEVEQRLQNYRPAPALLNPVLDFVVQAGDNEVARINPHALARKLGVGERDLLHLLAICFREGIFTLNWEVQCPACHGRASYFRSPRESYHQVQCAACGNRFAAHFDDHVQVTFSIHPSIRATGQKPAAKLKVMLPPLADESVPPLTAHELLTVQLFRDFFKNEALPEGESFEVRRATLLFTDLTDSTAMYVRKGDPNAYSLVREHFEVLRRVVERNEGAIVKTIGDAIMAVFLSERAAFRAALEMQRDMNNFNQSRPLPPGEHLLLKIGIHAGPSIYVTLDERLDYFGTTVNTAARVQAQANSNEIVFTDDVLSAPGVRELIAGAPLRDNRVMLKGLQEPVHLWHLKVST